MQKDGDKASESDPSDYSFREMSQWAAFPSQEGTDSFVDGYMRPQIQQGIADYHWLSSEMVQNFIYAPFDSPQYVAFTEAPAASLTSPIMRLLVMLVEAIGEKGLKFTATGNLPRNFVRTSAQAYFEDERYRKITKNGQLRSEADFFDLRITRFVAQTAGIIRKYKGKFVLCRKYQTLITKKGIAALYLPMLRAYATKLCWNLNEWDGALYIIQDSFLFSLYLLNKFGNEWRDKSFYEDAFLRAFPQIDKMVAYVRYGTAESFIRNQYSIYTLGHFAALLGLVEERKKGDFNHRVYEYRKLPLLDSAIIFSGD